MAKRLGATQLVPIWHVMRWFSTPQRRRLGVFLFGSSPSWARKPLVAIHKISFQRNKRNRCAATSSLRPASRHGPKPAMANSRRRTSKAAVRRSCPALLGDCDCHLRSPCRAAPSPPRRWLLWKSAHRWRRAEHDLTRVGRPACARATLLASRSDSSCRRCHRRPTP